MKRTTRLVLAGVFLLVAPSCSTTSSGAAAGGGAGGHGATAGTGGGSSGCTPCLSASDCSAGNLCGQFAGDAYCAPDCSSGKPCAADSACTPVASSDGAQIQVCIPITNPCAGGSGGSSGSGGGAAGTPGGGGSGGQSDVCGVLDGPSVAACCKSCSAGQSCQQNGCYGGWWCNTGTCKCQPPPGTCNSGTGGSGGTGGTAGGGGNGGSVTGVSGGVLDTLSFAVVGDTRPPTDDDTAGYPTQVITQIWKDVQAQNPRPALAISTGDYMFAKANGTQGSAQLDIYLSARSQFSNVVFPAMGNHECTGQTPSNCGAGNADGITNNYTAFMTKLLAPLGVNSPYYVVNIGSTTNAWTAKLVVIAANAWDSTQSSWLSATLAQPTTYTFVVRHEGTTATTAPGVTPSDAIMAQYPYTLLIAGHTHTFAYYKNERQMIVGNGGAPLAGSVNYGYVIGRQRADGAIEFHEYDYATNAVNTTFAVKADGSAAP